MEASIGGFADRRGIGFVVKITIILSYATFYDYFFCLPDE
jgi:hypothetical protein